MIRLFVLIALALLAATSPAGAAPRYDTAANARLFDRVWSLVDRRYWGRNARRDDWARASERYRPDALAAADEPSLYRTLNAMLATMGDSHLYAFGPSRRRRSAPDPATAEIEWEWRAQRRAGGVLLLTMHSFDPGADRWLLRQLAEAPAPSAVILDLRGNGGGDSRTLDRIAGSFFTERRAVLRLVGDEEEVEWTRGAGPNAYSGSLAVLVGPRTASAAEAFAAMIQEAGRGAVVGGRTAGRLTGALHHRLPDGGELSLPGFDVRTPGGDRLEGKGLEPRHRVGANGDALGLAERLVRTQATAWK